MLDDTTVQKPLLVGVLALKRAVCLISVFRTVYSACLQYSFVMEEVKVMD